MVKTAITAIILAGGQSSRMGGKDKGLIRLGNKKLYQHVIDRIKIQVDTIFINCNRNQKEYQLSNYVTFCDDVKGYLGPLSGIYSGLLRSQTEWNLVVSCDTPYLPANLSQRLLEKVVNHNAAYVFDGDRYHPTIVLINKSVTEPIKSYLDKGERKLMFFLQEIDAIAVDFSDQKNNFININTPADLSNWGHNHGN